MFCIGVSFPFFGTSLVDNRDSSLERCMEMKRNDSFYCWFYEDEKVG